MHAYATHLKPEPDQKRLYLPLNLSPALKKPAQIFRFEEVQDAHRLMESSQANGRIVVTQ